LIANKLLLDEMSGEQFNGHSKNNKVHVGHGSQVGEGVKLNGPVIIGENCVLQNCIIGPNTTIASGCSIKNCQIDNSIVLENCTIDCDKHISNSLFGKNIIIKNKNSQEGCQMIIGDQTKIEI